jgi:hypothetical protein
MGDVRTYRRRAVGRVHPESLRAVQLGP